MATFKRYLMFQAMMFVFGIVGPIFLIMFFASQPDPTLRWAYWWGLFITTGDVLIALSLTAGSANDAKAQKDARIAAGQAKRVKGSRGRASDQSSPSSSFDPFSSTSLTFFSNDAPSSDSSSSSDYSSSDSGSSDSGSSSGDSGSSSSSD